MINQIATQPFYRTTQTIESNTLLNRGIIDIFGYALPSAINANNKYEARERLVKSSAYFAIAFLSPILLLPMFSKHFLKKAGIIAKKGAQNFNKKEFEVVRLSKEHLVDDAKDIPKELRKLAKNLMEDKKTGHKFKGIDKAYENIIKRFEGKEEELKEKLIKAHSKIATMDYLTTGLMINGAVWGINELTKKQTGRSGFSAEFEMADENYTKKKSEKHEKNKFKKILIALGILGAGAPLINKFIEKSMLKENPTGLMNRVKNNAAKFNYTSGKYMKILPYFLITLIGDLPPYMLAVRDNYERRDAFARWGFAATIFFGGDAVLNNIFGNLFDKIAGTKLINREKIKKDASWLKRAMAPTYSLEQLKELASLKPKELLKKGFDKKTLSKTQKFGQGMYWLNLGLIIAILGTGLPKILNKVLKSSIDKDLANQKTTPQEILNFQQKILGNKNLFKEFV